MGSQPPPTSFHITGFKRFEGVPINPSEVLVASLPAYLAKSSKPLPAGCSLASCTVLETAGLGALPALVHLLRSGSGLEEKGEEKSARGNEEEGESADGAPSAASAVSEALSAASAESSSTDATRKAAGRGARKLIEEPKAGKDIRHVWIHLGVNCGATKFAVERSAVNEATFRCADEMGWKPQKERISSEDGALSIVRQTTLPALWIVDVLRTRRFDVCLSDDAGRFVCNYVYYQSLRFAAAVEGVASIFVHIPPFQVLSEATQLRFLAGLLEVLSSC